MNIPTILNNLIAMVVVILVLSLVVQSLQSGLKKVLKIKSRQIEDSLVDLFEHVLDKAPRASGGWRSQSPLLRLIFRGKHPADVADPAVQTLYNNVMAKFAALGRVSQSGRQMLNSLAKEDLLKVLEKVGPDQLASNFKDGLSNVEIEIQTLEQLLKEIDPSSLGGDTSAKFAVMRSTFVPLLNDFRAIASGDTTVRPPVLIGEVTSLRELKVNDALVVLGEIQAKLEKDLAAAREAAIPAGGTPTESSRQANAAVPILEKTAKDFNAIAAALTRLRTQFDSAIAPLRGKLREVESWFDTVMQSFDERYARGMKTWAIALSFVVVVLLNANFFRLYERISNSETTRDALVQSEPTLKELRVAADNAAAEAKNDQATIKLNEEVKKERNLIKREVSAYSNVGFEPLSWQQVTNWATGKGSWEIGWPGRLRHMLKIFLGWMIMTLLLSVGAPFWEDTLESLFGLKSLLRTGSETRNVEARSGEGQPKT
jgi:hypothetical protein